MDINELIDNLRFPSWYDLEDPDATLLTDAATALSTLQAENEKLRAELEQVKAERDAAVERIREWEKFDTYLFVHNFITPEKWRGPGKENCP